MQKIVSLLPSHLRLWLTPIYRGYSAALYKLKNPLTLRKTREELHLYWTQPWDGVNLPEDYVEGEERSKFLVHLVSGYADPQSNILEVGCNVGRNLHYLYLAGFRQLAGIEISEKAVRMLRQVYPELGRQAKIFNAPAEKALLRFEDNVFDIVFTMAVLEHIHPKSKSVFSEMARITRCFLITIEDEREVSWRHFPRNYLRVFEPIGLKQVYEFNCDRVVGLGSNFVARVFKKP